MRRLGGRAVQVLSAVSHVPVVADNRPIRVARLTRAHQEPPASLGRDVWAGVGHGWSVPVDLDARQCEGIAQALVVEDIEAHGQYLAVREAAAHLRLEALLRI